MIADSETTRALWFTLRRWRSLGCVVGMSCKWLSAMGIPVGSELEFADEVTVLKSVEGRREI